MKQSHRLAILALACGLLVLPSSAHAKDITVMGSWSLTIDATDLVSGAGSDLNDTYESASDQVLITISNCASKNDRWRVDVSRTDSLWHNDLVLWVQRTGDGAGEGRISRGETYQEVSTANEKFFRGQGDLIDIPIQLQLTGVSISILPDTYSTTVTYTMFDIW